MRTHGFTSYFRRWNRNYEGGLCAFAECVHAKVITPATARKADTPWKIALWLGRDTEENEIIVATEDGVLKVRAVWRLPPSQQWRSEPVKSLQALSWKPQVREEPTTDFDLPRSLTVTGKIRDPPGLERPIAALEPGTKASATGSDPATEAIADQPPALQNLPSRSADISIGEAERSPTVRRSIEEEDDRPAKANMIDPDAPSVPPLSKAQRIACCSLHHELDLRTGRCSEGHDERWR